MDVEIVVPDREDFPGAVGPVLQAFGMTDLDAPQLADEKLLWDAVRPLGARVDGQWVGAAGDFPFELTVPGGACVPTAGVTMVGVLSTHRRQGILRALMARELDEVAARGEPLAALMATESSIYGRYGYGPGTMRAQVEIETARSTFATSPAVDGRLKLLEKETAIPLVRQVYDRLRPMRAGTVNRDDWKWEERRRDTPAHRDGASARFWVVHEDDSGQPDGYATYRVRERWDHGLPCSTIAVEELYGLSSDIEAAMWRFLCDIDLADRVVANARPLDDPLRWWLVEPRRLRTTSVSDWLWVRVLDVSAALSARRYEVDRDHSVVLDVVDRSRPASGGRFRLDAGPDGAACTSTTAAADLTLDTADLGSCYLGGVAPSTLAAAHRIEENRSGAIARADALFLTRRLPFCDTGF